MRRYKVVLLRCICFPLIIAFMWSCSHSPNIDTYTETMPKDYTINFLHNSQNKDGGYPALTQELSTPYDVYYLYYLMLMKEELKKTLTTEDSKSIFKYITDDSKRILFREGQADELSPLYYFTSMFYKEVLLTPEIKDEIIGSIEKPKIEDSGYYSLSKIDKSGNPANDDKILTYSSYMATYILSLLGENLDDPASEEWLVASLSNIRVFDLSTASDLMLIIKMCNLRNIDISQYQNEIEEKITFIVQELVDQNDFNMLFLDPVIELIELYPGSGLSLYPLKVKVDALQSKDTGWFSIDPNSAENILPTYIAIKFYNYENIEIKNSELIEKNINNYKLGHLYLFYNKKPSLLFTTYYTDKIISLTSNQRQNYSTFLQEIDFSKLSAIEKYYYLALGGQIITGIDSMLDSLYIDLDKFVLMSDYSGIVFILKAFDLLNHRLPNEKIDMIITSLNTNNNLEISSKDTRETIVMKHYYTLLLNEHVNLDTSVKESIEYLKTTVESSEEVFNKSYNIEILFMIAELLEENKIFFDYEAIREKVKKATLYNTFIKAGSDPNSQVSYLATYIAMKYGINYI
ncbi:hypothetical protein [Paenibacillus sp. NRS-1760]|uniref:hypothetical protein n=1 Tax=Paenibacillus sp. NRS-1760 TaxID=3233902 RepID=UPI003D27B9E4